MNLSDIEEPQSPLEELEQEATGNFLDIKTVCVFFNNTIPHQDKEVSLNPIIKAGDFSMAIEDMIEISDIPMNQVVSIQPTKEDKFTMLLNAIPISSNTSALGKPTKTKRKSPKTDKTAAFLDDSETPPPPSPPPTPSVKEELKPIKAYNLQDLQMLARVHKIDTQKEGKAGKKVNKTKEEMYSEIKDKLDKLEK